MRPCPEVSAPFLSLLSEQLIGAFFGAALSFFALVWWEKIKEERDDRRSISAAKNELQVNHLHDLANLKVLQLDLDAQKENKSVIQNLTLLSTEELRYALSRLHKRASTDKLSFEIREVIHSTEIVNQKIKYRGMYQSHNEAMDNYNRRMTILDNNLIAAIEGLNAIITELVPKLHEGSGENLEK